MIRNHIVFSVFICLYSLAVPTVAQAQIPGTENLIKTPEITIGKKASSTYEKLKKVVAELEGAEQALQHDQSELVRCKETLADSAERKRALEKLRAETRFLLKKSPEGSVDPALLPHIKRALEVELELAESLAFLVETYKQEAHEVTAGAHQGKRLLQHLEARLNENPEPVEMSLDEILSYLSDLRMSRISLSLLKARRAGLNEELEQSQKEKSKVHEPPLLPDFAGSPQSREQTLRIREDMVDRHVLLNMLHKLLRKHVTGHINAQLQRIRIEIYAREENLNQLEARQEAVFASLTIPKDDLLAAEDRLRTTEERIASQERRYRQQLKELRLSSPEDNEETTFDAFKAWQVRVAVLQHWLYLLDIEKQVEQFRAASVLVLEQLISRQTIPMEYFDQFKWYLDASRQTKARAELSKRRDAWRQEYARLSLNEPAPGEEEMAAVILDSYQELLDLYDQIDARKWDLEWCAELVRFYRDRYEIGKRDLFWYSWRAGVSLGVLILAILLSLMIGRLTLRPLKKRRQAPGWMRLTLFMTYIGSLILIWTSLLVVTLTQVWGSLFGFAAFGEIFTNTLFTIGDKEVSLSAFIGLIIVLMLTGVVSRMIVRFIQNHIFPYFTWDGGVEDAVSVFVRWLVMFAGFVLGLEFVGIGFGVLALFAGVIGIGIGFGLQAIAGNFLAGFTILFERPIKKGDYVETDGLEGRVEAIGTRATTLTTRDQVALIVPNSQFVSGRVVNWSHGEERIRLHIPVGVAYGSDVRLVSRLLTEVAGNHARILSSPSVEVWFLGFGDSSLNFELLAWTQDVEMKYHTISDINFAIDAAFRDNNVTIPFPQRDVHIKPTDK